MDMKEYMTPEMEVVKMNFKTVLLAGSDGQGSTPTGQDDPEPGGGIFD